VTHSALLQPELSGVATFCIGFSLEQPSEDGFAEYYEPFTGEPLGSREQSRTATVALDWLAAGEPRSGAIAAQDGPTSNRMEVV